MEEKRNSHQLEAEVDSSELMDGIHYTGNKGPWFGARHSMILLVSLGSGLVLVTTTGFTIVLVAMISSNTSSNADIPTYDWTNKGVILSSSMWPGIPLQLVAGALGRKYGHRWLILVSFVINVIFFMLIPVFAQLGGSTGVIFCRVMEGAAIAIMSPLISSISGIWVPAEERSKAGMVGIGFAFLFGSIASIAAGQITASSIGYPGCCYIFGGICLIWGVMWTFLAHQSPATHPRITPEERKYIETSLNSQKTEHIPVPWVKLFISIHFWAPVVAGIGTTWIDTIMSSVNLLFVTKAWKIDIDKSTSTFAVAPFIGLIFGVGLAPLSDFLIKRKYLRLVNARKIFHTVGSLSNAAGLLWMTLIPPHGSMALIVLILCVNNVSIIACSVGGAGLNMLDIAPAFAGITSGFSSTISQCFGLIAPLTIDWIVTDESDFGQWRLEFLVTAIIVVVTTIFFDIFATDKRQWENENEPNDK